MSPADLPPLAATGRVVAVLAGRLAGLFDPGSDFSLFSLVAALAVGTAFVLLRRRRRVRFRALVRAFFPRRWLVGASSRLDLMLFLFNTLLAGVLFGGAVLSYRAVAGAVTGGLVRGLGQPAPAPLPAWAASGLITVALFLAYELGYWINHRMSHAIPVLWRFHKVHHTAQTLSPLTNFRVHPVDGLLFLNTVALTAGVVDGGLTWALGRAPSPYLLSGNNVILLVFTFTVLHLQHTQLWIAFTGAWGRVLMSPAHHQLHHSADPAHFNSNFGSALSLWDWLFGTLRMPTARNPRLRFGVEGEGAKAHTLEGGLVTPLVEVAGLALSPLRPRAAARSEPAST